MEFWEKVVVRRRGNVVELIVSSDNDTTQHITSQRETIDEFRIYHIRGWNLGIS